MGDGRNEWRGYKLIKKKKRNYWKILFLPCNYTFCFTNLIKKNKHYLDQGITLTYTSILLLIRSPLSSMLILSSSTWEAQFIDQILHKAFSNHLLSPPGKTWTFPKFGYPHHVLHTSFTSLHSCIYSTTLLMSLQYVPNNILTPEEIITETQCSWNLYSRD